MGGRDVNGGMKFPTGVSLSGTGRGNLQIRFMYKGVRCKETLKLKPTKANIKYAGLVRDGILSEIARGIFDYSTHFPNSQRVLLFGGVRQTKATVGDSLTAYLASLKCSTATSTWNDYESIVRHHLVPAFGSIPLKDLTTGQIKAWRGTLTISNKRINNVLIPLRGMLKDAFADGLIERDPMVRISNLSIQRGVPDPFSIEEIELVLDTAKGQSRNFFQFAFFTGMRTGELIALEWGDIDWVREVVMVQRNSVRKEVKSPKTDAGVREIVLLPQSLQALEMQKQHSLLAGGRIFLNPKTGQPWETDAQIRRTSWEHILKKCGVRYRTPYQTRHTYASLMLSLGENPMWVAQQMGHKDWGLIRERYGKWIPSTDPNAGKKAGSKLPDFLSKSGRQLADKQKKPTVSC
jgi:integrase